MPGRQLAGVVGLLLLHPLATLLVLPSLPLLQARYDASPQAAAWTLSATVFGFAVTQLLWGALNDRWGCRRVAGIGVGCFIVSTVGCAFASSIWQIAAWRLLQGAGVAAAGIAARAALQVQAPHETCARRMATAFAWLSVVGVLGPAASAALAEQGGWPSLLTASLSIGVLVGWVGWQTLPTDDSRPSPQVRVFRGTAPSPELSSEAKSSMAPPPETVACSGPGPQGATWRRVLGHRAFQAYAALAACSYAGHYLCLVGSAALWTDRYGLALGDYGLLLSAGSLVHLAGAWLCQRWVAAHGTQATVARAALIGLAGGLAMAILAIAGVHATWAVALPYALYLFAHAMHQSCGQAAVMAPFPDRPGTASALAGTLLPIAAVMLTTAMAVPLARSPLALPLGVAGCALLTAMIAWTRVRRLGNLAGGPFGWKPS